MPLDGKVLGKEIANAIKIGDKSDHEQMWQEISEIIVKHIQTYAVVDPVGLIAPPYGGSVTGIGKVK